MSASVVSGFGDIRLMQRRPKSLEQRLREETSR